MISGIILTSGDVQNVIGPNNATGTTTDNSMPGSPTLDALIPGYSTYDAAILEFDFMPTGNEVEFSYVFGWEEHNEYVNSQFNDVFGFFVNGLNQALIPGASTPVSVNNVNCGYASGANAAPGIGTNCLYYINNANPTYTGLLDAQLDGLTTVLSMIADVNPNVTNHMFIGIADAGDGMLDSAVFIKGGSFSVCGVPGQPPSGGGWGDPRALYFLLLGAGMSGAFYFRKKFRG